MYADSVPYTRNVGLVNLLMIRSVIYISSKELLFSNALYKIPYDTKQDKDCNKTI